MTDQPADQSIDLRTPKRIHIVGVGGSGMSAIAEVLLGSGHTVSGSDLNHSIVIDRLRDRGIEVTVGHDAANVGEVDVVTHSTAIPPTNPELVEARSRDLPVLRRADTLAEITRAWRTVAVAGTHGKTTTSAMLTAALTGAGFDPAYIVGGDLRDLDRGAAVGSGEFLVVEADESDGTFIRLTPKPSWLQTSSRIISSTTGDSPASNRPLSSLLPRQPVLECSVLTTLVRQSSQS